MKRFIKAALIYFSWAIFLPVFVLFPQIPSALVMMINDRWPS